MDDTEQQQLPQGGESPIESGREMNEEEVGNTPDEEMDDENEQEENG